MHKNIISIILCFVFFLVGTFSVTIANVLWNQYFFVLLLEAVISTTYICIYLDNNSKLNENKINFVLMIFLVVSDLIFYIVNDLIDYPIYKHNYFNFFSTFVMLTQVLSLFAIIFNLILLCVDFSYKDKNNKGFIDQPKKDKNDFALTDNEINKENVPKEKKDSSEKEIENSDEANNYLISELPDKSVPFMDKEK